LRNVYKLIENEIGEIENKFVGGDGGQDSKEEIDFIIAGLQIK
jgi:hypothetical protein